MEEFPKPKTPDMKYDFQNGIIKANEDMAFLGISKGDTLQPKFDGTYWAVGPLTWSAEQLAEEIDGGTWTFEKTS
ncbi:MAG: hypothetical protein JWM20_933 [Patescibacteria group bacterium]|nr:hypothetical protein [Patescibacteria group bacterium]